MVGCRACGTALVGDARFCPSCGAPAASEAPVVDTVTCPYCGEAAEVEAEECPACLRRIPDAVRAAGSMGAAVAAEPKRPKSMVWSVVGGVFILFAVIRLLAALLNLGYSEATQQGGKDPAGEHAYRSEQFGFSLNRPSGWDQLGPDDLPSDPNIVFQVVWAGGTDTAYPLGGVVILPRADSDKPSTAASAWRRDIRRLLRRFGVGKAEVELARLDDRPAVRWEWRRDIDGRQVHELDYSVFTRRYIYQLTFAASPRTYEASEPIFMKMVASFRVE